MELKLISKSLNCLLPLGMELRAPADVSGLASPVASR